MHNPHADWTHLKTILAIARARTLSKAAVDLRINQSTASRHLRAMEEAYGVQLFTRSKTAVAPTEQGLAVIAAAERMESAVLEMTERVAATKLAPQGLVRVISMPWICQRLILPRLGEFTRRYPMIEIEVLGEPGDRPIDKGECEMELRFERPPNRRVKQQALGNVNYAIYGPAGVDPDTLRWIGFRDPEREFMPETFVKNAEGGDTVALWANDANLLCEAVRAGIGKALLPDAVAAEATGIERLSADRPEMIRPLYVHATPDAMRLKRGSLFLDWLAKVIDERLAP